MGTSFHEVITSPAFEDDFRRAVIHARFVIQRYIWRGFKRLDNGAMVAGKCAEDFVLEALGKFHRKERKYDNERSLLQNLNSTTDSLIWSHKNTVDRDPFIDHEKDFSDDGSPIDPVSLAAETEVATVDLGRVKVKA